MTKEEFKIQCIDEMISSKDSYLIKEELDKDYKYLVGISISDVKSTKDAILQQIKLKGNDILPENFNAIHLVSSVNVEPNKRFFAWFSPIQIAGDEISIKYIDQYFTENYNLQINLLLCDNPIKLQNALFS